MTDLAQAGLGYDVESLLAFNQVVSSSGSQWSRVNTDVITLISNANAFNPNNKCSRRFGDQVGTTSRGNLTLRSQDGAHEVVLRNPEVDNARRSSFSRVLRETRGGSLTVYRDSNWPIIKKLLYTIVANKRTEIDSLQAFFNATLGLNINLIDWLGEEWTGIVLNPNEPATEDREGYWTVSFEFEGVKKESNSGNQNLTLTHQATYTLVPGP